MIHIQDECQKTKFLDCPKGNFDAFEYLDHQGRGAVILTEQTGRVHLISKSDGKLWKRSVWPHHGGRPGRRVKMGVGGTW